MVQDLRQIWGNSPWLIFEDFNAIRTSTEGIGSSDFDLGAMEDFNNCLDALDVIEYPSKGCLFTWCNKREVEDKIYSRIDWIFTNEAWFSYFPVTEVEILGPGISDHSSISVEICENVSFGPNIFQKFWMKHRDFQSILLER